MSRKSRQKKGRSILSKLPPVWVLIFLLIVGLGMGSLSISAPWTSRPVAYEDTTALSATLTRIEGDYDYQRKRGWKLDDIYLYFSDHDRLRISGIITSKSLLHELQSFPAGTVFDMRLEPNGIDVMALSVDGVDVLSYEAACRAIHVNNAFGFLLGLFMLFMATCAAWSLYMTWTYRRLTP